ncbi:acyltransferase family protein [Rosenbergiella collisarenosi]|uniref:acyltransferase family protein n=1 Tax=Rosenbergiella collisarenosi TaxID=1544695 RepID=UPI003BA8E93D
MINNNKNKIEALDGLRGIAVIAVVLYHYSWFVHPLELSFLRRGYIGVDIFFIISGFLACYTTKNYGLSIKSAIKYLCLRLVRVYPAYFIVTIIVFSINNIFSLSSYEFSALAKSLLFMPQSRLNPPSYGEPILNVGWTLNYEFFFT